MPMNPLTPLRALAYFRSLVPIAGIVDPQRWGQDQRRHAFTLAVQTEQVILEKVKASILEGLETGRVANKPQEIQRILEDAGVAPASPSYAEMTFRTNMMDALNVGVQEELQAASDDFPAWQYMGIRDGRQGEDHEPHFDHYYPTRVSFQQVRGPRVYNCRCTQRPVSKREWARLQSRGVAFNSFAEEQEQSDFPLYSRVLDLPDIRQTTDYTCGPSAAMAAARYHGIGPENLQSWIEALGTTAELSTHPSAIVDYLRRLGLQVEERQRMTLRQLAEYIRQGRPVICPVQDYSESMSDLARFDYGHYVSVCGVVGQPGDRYVIAQDPSDENLKREPGGDVAPDLSEEIDTIDAPGRILVRAKDWLKAWHDKDIHGRFFIHYGIAVGPPLT